MSSSIIDIERSDSSSCAMLKVAKCVLKNLDESAEAWHHLMLRSCVNGEKSHVRFRRVQMTKESIQQSLHTLSWSTVFAHIRNHHHHYWPSIANAAKREAPQTVLSASGATKCHPRGPRVTTLHLLSSSTLYTPLPHNLFSTCKTTVQLSTADGSSHHSEQLITRKPLQLCVPSLRTSTSSRSARPRLSAFVRNTQTAFQYVLLFPSAFGSLETSLKEPLPIPIKKRIRKSFKTLNMLIVSLV